MVESSQIKEPSINEVKNKIHEHVIGDKPPHVII